MKQIDGLVTKDEIYRLISDFRTRFKISEEAGHEMAVRVAEMPTIESEPDNGWISVEDRLPDDEKRYLICTESRMDNIEIAYYQPIGDKFSDYEPFWQGDSCRFTTSVTHWQPLPKRPKGE